MKTITKTIEIQEDVWELTRGQLMVIRRCLFGGNADLGNAELMEQAAKSLSRAGNQYDTQLANALHDRAPMITEGLKMIDDLLWPSSSAPSDVSDMTKDHNTK